MGEKHKMVSFGLQWFPSNTDTNGYVLELRKIFEPSVEEREKELLGVFFKYNNLFQKRRK